MLRIAIVEDDSRDAARLGELLKKYEKERNGDHSFTIEYANDSLNFLDHYNPEYDIIFFDIEMPHINGMEAAKKIYQKDKDVAIIFVTNLEQYAVYGYQIEAVGYILKPLTYNELADVMAKTLRRIAGRAENEVVLHASGSVHRMPVADILYIDIFSHTLTYHTLQGEYRVRGKLSDAEKALAPFHFALCNKSYLVNLQHVKDINKNIVKVGDDELLISRGKQKIFLDKFLQYLSSRNT